MMFRTQGIVIAKRDFREHDRIYTIYTETHGKIEVLGRGARKITSKLASHLEPPALVDLFIVRGRIFDHVANARRLHSYNNVRTDYTRALELAKAAAIFDKEVKLEQKDPRLYGLLYDFLNKLDGMHPSFDTANTTPTPAQSLRSYAGLRLILPLSAGGGEEGVDPKIISAAFLTQLTSWTSYGIFK